MTRLQDPLNTHISSGHPVAGPMIRAYKRLVKRLIDPYLRHVFDREHENLSLINLRLEKTDDEIAELQMGQLQKLDFL